MSNRHLPAGQNIQGGVGGMPSVDMAGGMGAPRRRQPPPYVPQYHHQPQHQLPHQHQHVNPLYANYMPYAPQQYYASASAGSDPASYPILDPLVPNASSPDSPDSPKQENQFPQLLLRQSRLLWKRLRSLSEHLPDSDFPVRTTKSRRRRKPLNANSQAVSLPVEQHEAAAEQIEQSAAPESSKDSPASTQPSIASDARSENQRQSVEAVPSTPTTPSSLQQRSRTNTATSATPTAGGKPATRHGAHPVPAVPALPKGSAKDAKPTRAEKPVIGEAASETVVQDTASTDIASAPVEQDSSAADTTTSAPAKAPPSSWANLFAKSAAAAAAGRAAGPNGSSGAEGTNGNDADGVVGGPNGSAASFSKANASSVAEAIHAYHVGGNDKISFLEPRGLINTGNMCYMNSVSQRAVHSFKSETPLIDAMIMFMHEYKLIKSAPSVDALRRALKNEELERYGEPFTPEFVYEAIRQLSRFASMRSLDDECTSVMGSSLFSGISDDATAASGHDATDPTGDWLEVGRKQRAAVTRSAGSNSTTPITKIFGGLLRSEFRVPGLKDSITTEPYQPLQLDIGSPDVRNVVDALRGLTRPERMQGDFNSPRGKDVTATKQVFIESLPPVLILHLKRFQFNAEGNDTVKIWKKIGYPLDLEIPREALSRQTRQTLGEGGMPKYKLISVVYHHGKNASGGHYTVDVRRQEGQEWIRLDDTVIRRVRSDDVAEGGEEEEIKETRNEGPTPGASGNRFGAMLDEDTGDEDGWKQVTTAPGGNKRWSSVVNGAGNGSGKGKHVKDSIKDNKVAYLLFYQRV
ncbi:hypothetical protein G7Z17_g7848 [Cylindrodendrum hubeiense]|uniref:Ubiquitin carboxyl-terminal hydrolase n=1 Tax=Cylindrodendrum hubeiense TaxID=595255 RepID=A0A9P5H895_9HYPO|nr:hypothetical protein G7Z17_g7848 [Cylindrodendrum hubeiense]